MSKVVRLEPIGQDACVETNHSLLTGLLANNLDVQQECGGRGICATCHVFVKSGMEHLSPLSRREQRTLGILTSCKTTSRLACQALVQGDDVVVEIPSGMYLTEIDEIEAMIGSRAPQAILHPISGKVLVEKRKLITRTMIQSLSEVQSEVNHYLASEDN